MREDVGLLAADAQVLAMLEREAGPDAGYPARQLAPTTEQAAAAAAPS